MKLSKICKVAAMIILGMMAVFLVIFGYKDIRNIITAVAGVLLAVLGWKRPIAGGLALAVIGILIAMYFLLFTPAETVLPPLLFITLPMEVSGLLLIEGDWSQRKER